MMDNGNLRLRARHPQSHQGVCADAVATLEGISRQDVDELGVESQKRAAAAITGGYFDKSLVPVYHEDGSLALDREEYPRPQTTLEGLAALKPAFPTIADYPLDDKGTTYRKLILDKYPDLDIDFMLRYDEASPGLISLTHFAIRGFAEANRNAKMLPSTTGMNQTVKPATSFGSLNVPAASASSLNGPIR